MTSFVILLHMQSCIFCEMSAKNVVKQDVIYEDDRLLIKLDTDWAVKGHTLVIWKKHLINASELTMDDYLYFSRMFYKTEKALLSILNVDKSIILKTGGLVSHFHFHIYPVDSNISW